ncbi:hypothetical protein HYH03_015787 [Edaphochlamys debaryana]|uniref:WD repeat-containing protein 54 beta-propeller domain-containing protein n=1 Tax=Edaphochlamys debaryana TaxID=47281 RepID=A0A836BS63_9CHLO|nr:hypothetical protein HYH03_015787 [Edaphochlamys debaryana]|eukprot:KAG2485514.1 hypothetical protein HYH03_015787 [Edaphochlamys debaryana]
MPYSEKQLVKAPMKPSPSLLYNNLTWCAGSLVYAHIRQACTFPLAALGSSGVPVAVRKVESQHSDVIHSVVACAHNANSYLVLATDAGIQIWDKTVTHLLHVWALPSAAAPDLAPRHGHFARGVAINVTNDGVPCICFGTSTGAVFSLGMGDDSGKFKPAPVQLPRHHTAPITCVGTAYQSRQGKWTEDLGCHLVTCDEEGGIAVWEALVAAQAAGHKLLSAVAPTGVPVVAVAVRRELVVAARLDGAVQVYGLRDGKLRADLGAASRFITAMDIHPTKDLIATVSEDCSLGVWSLPMAGAKPECLLSVCWLQAMLTGVAFCGPTNDDVAVVAYDTDEVHVYKCT